VLRNILQNAPVAGRRHDQGLRAQPLDSGGQRGAQAAAVAGVVEPRVMHGAAGCCKFAREVPHRGQKQRGARLRRPDMGRFFGDLGHPDGVGRGVEVIERCGVQIELVTQHEHDAATTPQGAVFGPLAEMGAQRQAKALRDDPARPPTRCRPLEPRRMRPLRDLRLPSRLHGKGV
jgi:hypothetical protein